MESQEQTDLQKQGQIKKSKFWQKGKGNFVNLIFFLRINYKGQTKVTHNANKSGSAITNTRNILILSSWAECTYDKLSRQFYSGTSSSKLFFLARKRTFEDNFKLELIGQIIDWFAHFLPELC